MKGRKRSTPEKSSEGEATEEDVRVEEYADSGTQEGVKVDDKMKKWGREIGFGEEAVALTVMSGKERPLSPSVSSMLFVGCNLTPRPCDLDESPANLLETVIPQSLSQQDQPKEHGDTTIRGSSTFAHCFSCSSSSSRVEPLISRRAQHISATSWSGTAAVNLNDYRRASGMTHHCKHRHQKQKQEKGYIMDTWDALLTESTLQFSLEGSRTVNGPAFAFPKFAPIGDVSMTGNLRSGGVVEQKQKQQVQFQYGPPHNSRRYQVTNCSRGLLGKNLDMDRSDGRILSSDCCMWPGEHDKQIEYSPLLPYKMPDQSSKSTSAVSRKEPRLNQEVAIRDVDAGHWVLPYAPSSSPLRNQSNNPKSPQGGSARCEWMEVQSVELQLQPTESDKFPLEGIMLIDRSMSSSKNYGGTFCEKLTESSTRLQGRGYFSPLAAPNALGNADLNQEEKKGCSPCISAHDHSTGNAKNVSNTKNSSPAKMKENTDAVELGGKAGLLRNTSLHLSVPALGAHGLLLSPTDSSSPPNTRDERQRSCIAMQNVSMCAIYIGPHSNSSAIMASVSPRDNDAAASIIITGRGGVGDSANSANMQIDTSLDALFNVVDVSVEVPERKGRLIDGARPMAPLVEPMVLADSPLNFTLLSDAMQSVSAQEVAPADADNTNMMGNLGDCGVESELSKLECLSPLADHGGVGFGKVAAAAAAINIVDNSSSYVPWGLMARPAYRSGSCSIRDVSMLPPQRRERNGGYSSADGKRQESSEILCSPTRTDGGVLHSSDAVERVLRNSGVALSKSRSQRLSSTTTITTATAAVGGGRGGVASSCSFQLPTFGGSAMKK